MSTTPITPTDIATYTIAFPRPASPEAWLTYDLYATQTHLAGHGLIVNHDARTIEHWVEWSTEGTRGDVYFGQSDYLPLPDTVNAEAVYARAHELATLAVCGDAERWLNQVTAEHDDTLILPYTIITDVADYYRDSGMTGAAILADLGLSLDAATWTEDAAFSAAQSIIDGAPSNDCWIVEPRGAIVAWLRSLAADVAEGEDYIR